MSSSHSQVSIHRAVCSDLFLDDSCLRLDDVGHYHSGVNTQGLIRGYADAGQPICLPVADATDEILSLVGRVADRCKVLLDSGAFGAFTAAVRALDPTDQVPHFECSTWRAAAMRMATLEFAQVSRAYQTVAALHPQNVSIVLPDVVGFQAESLDLLSRYRQDFQWTIDSCVTTLLPIQRGPLAPAEYHRLAVERLGFIPSGWGFPSREAAMSIPEIVAGVHDALALGVHRIHFLGVGREGRRFAQILAAVNQIPGAAALNLTTDANTTRAYVGQGRPQTVRRYEILEAVPESWTRYSLDLDEHQWVAIRWGAFLDGEDAALLPAFHGALRKAGLGRGARADLYDPADMSAWLIPLLDPDTG